MRNLIYLLFAISLICGCRNAKNRDLYFLFVPVDNEFDSVVRDLELSYASAQDKDSLFRLTNHLSLLAARDSNSKIKKGRVALFRARFFEMHSSYAEERKENVENELVTAFNCFKDTVKYAYDIFRLRYIEYKLNPGSLEDKYYSNLHLLSQARNFGDSLTTAGILNNLGLLYLNLEDTITGLSYFNQSRHIFNELNLEVWEKRLLLSVAQASEIQDPKLSDSIYQDLLRFAVSKNDTTLLTIVFHSFYMRHPDIKYIKRALPLVEGRPGYENQEALYHCLIADDMVSEGKNDSASIMIRKSRRLINNRILPDYAATIYNVYGNILENEGAKDSALFYYHITQDLQDSLDVVRSTQEMIKRLTQQKIALSREESIRKSMTERTIYATVIIVLILLATAALTILYHRHTKLRIEKMDSDLKLTRNRLQLASSLTVVKENENTIDATITIITKLIDEGKISRSEGMSLCSTLKAQLSNREELVAFQEVYAQVHPDFMKRLLEIAPNLSENHKRLATYIAMGMNNRQIARVMNIDYKSVITARYRLRSRLKLNKDISLETLIQQIAGTD